MKSLFSWHCNPYRKWCRSWWVHWFDWLELFRELRGMWHRANYGYAPRDLWSLDGYLASWLPHALREYRERNCGVPFGMSEETWNRKLKLMEYAFVAAQHIQWNCDCYAEPGHNEYWQRRWDYCHKSFTEQFFSLWY